MGRAKSRPLTPKQSRFVAEYLVDLNATQAAIRAGYSQKTAHSQGPRLLENVEVVAALAVGQKKIAAKVGLTAEMVLGEIKRLAFSDLGQAFSDDGTLKKIHDIPEDTRRAISSWEQEELYEGADGEKFSLGQVKKLKTWDKTKNLELLAKHLKLITDKSEVSGPNGEPLTIEVRVCGPEK